MINNKRYDLIKIIVGDVFYRSKLPLILLVMVLMSATLVVATTNQTRLFTAKREQIILEKGALDIEWRNLILEENVLGDHSRVERIAIEKLQMQHVGSSQENIVVQPNRT